MQALLSYKKLLEQRLLLLFCQKSAFFTIYRGQYLFVVLIFVIRTIMMTTEKFSAYSYLLERTAKRVKQYAQIQFKNQNFGITVDQWSILKHLHQQEKAITQKALSERCEKDAPTLTRILDLLVKKELVARNPHPEDRRSFLIELTCEGKNKVEQLSIPIQSIRMHAWQHLDEQDFEQLKRILNTLYSNLSLDTPHESN
jgi:DNA-binding MarR family transcriptional regulator